MKTVASRIVMLSRLIPHGSHAAAAAAVANASTTAGSSNAESGDLCFDLGFSPHGQSQTKPFSPSGSLADGIATVGVSEELELSIMSPPPASAASAAADDNGTASRLSVSCSLEPRQQCNPGDSHSHSSLQSNDVSCMLPILFLGNK
jgi:hypothetical protein